LEFQSYNGSSGSLNHDDRTTIIVRDSRREREPRKGGIAMRVTSIQPIEYLKVHLAYDGLTERLPESINFFVAIVCKAAQQTASIVLLLFIVLLPVFALMKIIEAATITGYCNDMCTLLPSIFMVL
jgi:hypothetical protein